MDFTRQIIQLLSEPPGSFIYHLITLFALQVVFAISFSRWRREPDDDYARNMSWAAGAIFAGRLLLLLVGLYYSRNPETAAGILPPLEQAINTTSITLLVWALIPHSERHPRLFDILMVVTMIMTGVMYLFFAQEWFALAATGETAYHGTPQSSVWSLFQIAILTIGLGYLLFRGRALGALPPIILGTLLIAHIIHLWNYPEFVPTDTNVAYWVRLGNLIAIPLWAVYAYLYAMTPLLTSEARLQESVAKFGNSLDYASRVIATLQLPRRLVYSLEMVNRTFDTSYAAIGMIDSDDKTVITFYSLSPEKGTGELRNWTMNLTEHIALNAALSQGRSTELMRDGLGSRQLYAYFEAADQEATRSILIHPLAVNGDRIGLLILPAPGGGEQWSSEEQLLVPGLAHFIAQALVNSQTAAIATESDPEPEPIEAAALVPAAIVMDRVRLQDMEHQLQQLRETLAEAEQKRRHAEANATAAQKQARYLAAALRAVQSPPNHAEGNVANTNVAENVNRETK